MNKLKIGIFVDSFFPTLDGVVMVVDNLAKRFCEHAEVTVFGPSSGKKGFIDNYPYKVVRAKCFKVPFLDYYLAVPSVDRNFLKQLKNADLDIVHIHSPFTLGKIGVKYAKKHKLPLIGNMHSQFKQDFRRATPSKVIVNQLLATVMKVYNQCDENWAVNAAISKLYVEYGAKKVPGVLNNGTDFKLIEKKAESDKKINKLYNLKPDELVYLFVGRINKLKNIMFIADALKIVKDKGHNFKMLFVGTGTDEAELKERIHKLGLENNVIFCGKVTNRDVLAGIYNRARLFLFPSYYDANSLVQIEAASQKTPTIFLEGSATSATVTNEVNAFVVENNIEAFANKIIQASTNDEYYNKIAEGAYRDLYKSWDDIANECYNRYFKMINDYKNNNIKKIKK